MVGSLLGAPEPGAARRAGRAIVRPSARGCFLDALGAHSEGPRRLDPRGIEVVGAWEGDSCFLEWRPHAGGPWRRLWGEEYPRGVHRHRRRSVNQPDRGNHLAAWQEPHFFTTEIRCAFRSLR